MPKLMIRCPKTGKAIFTGIVMDKASFESSSLSENSVQCTECGNAHTWNKDGAFLE